MRMIKEKREIKEERARKVEDYKEFISKEWLLKNLMFETDKTLVEGAPCLHVYYPAPEGENNY